jgi:hypothetical protein
MGEMDGPGEAVGHLFGEVGGAGAGFEGGASDVAESSDGVDGVGGVGDGAVAEDFALGIEDTELDSVLGVVECDEQW